MKSEIVERVVPNHQCRLQPVFENRGIVSRNKPYVIWQEKTAREVVAKGITDLNIVSIEERKQNYTAK